MTSGILNLSKLQPGQVAAVSAIHASESLNQRLRAMGFRTGQTVQLVRRAAFFGPLHVRVGSTDVIIRRDDAKLINVTKE